MILLKRLTGSTLAINPDLMERVESNPDTIVTLVDGKKVLVHETVEEIVALVLEYRSEIIRSAFQEAQTKPFDPTPPLRLIVGPADDEVDGDGVDHAQFDADHRHGATTRRESN